MIISKKYILRIKEFMINFLNLEYDGNNKLTHDELNDFLIQKGRTRIKRINMKYIKNSDILKGKYLFVRDEVGKTIAYQRPNSIQYDSTENRIKANLDGKHYLESLSHVKKETIEIEEPKE